ncbi:hypothetical protein QY95_01353 [Bacillus thermotolerans]|uniref:Uncharacterized protein n=1 Tax=Bacillus thermotolerans TaxID=1221996 RepID=A0A0F5I540_BACTR|nr:hypothetical protein QY95_01353 [Bacillus thermotolerans]
MYLKRSVNILINHSALMKNQRFFYLPKYRQEIKEIGANKQREKGVINCLLQ